MILFPGNECTTSASGFWERQDYNYRTELNRAGHWNAGGHAPQWVEIDLGSNSPISYITANVNQEPNGETHHIFKLGTDKNDLNTIRELKQLTEDQDEIRIEFEEVQARYVRIESVKSPSWIAWANIRVGNHAEKKIKSARK